MKKISPDDNIGGRIPGDRVRGRAWLQGRFARSRRWGSGKKRTEPDSPSDKPVRRLKAVEWVPPVMKLSENTVSPVMMRVGSVVGWTAFGSLVAFWLVALLGIVAALMPGGGDWWENLLGPVFWTSLVLTQLGGFLCESLTSSRCCWGMRALVGFWITMLAWLPLGMLIRFAINLLP